MKDRFAVVLKLTLDSMLKEKTIIMNGFKKAGLFPYKLKYVNLNVLKKRKNVILNQKLLSFQQVFRNLVS